MKFYNTGATRGGGEMNSQGNKFNSLKTLKADTYQC